MLHDQDSSVADPDKLYSQGIAAFVLTNLCCLQIYVVGGLQTNMTSYAPFIEVYDPVLDHWEVPMLPADIEPRAFAAMCTL